MALRRKPLLFVLLFAGLAAVIAAAVLAIALSPERVRLRTESVLARLLERPVRIENAHVDRQGNLHVRGIHVPLSPVSPEVSISLESDLDVQAGWLGLLKGARGIRTATFSGTTLRIEVLPGAIGDWWEGATGKNFRLDELPRVEFRDASVEITYAGAGSRDRIVDLDITLDRSGRIEAGGSLTGRGRFRLDASVNPPTIELETDPFPIRALSPHPLLRARAGLSTLQRLDPEGEIRLSVLRHPETQPDIRVAVGFAGVSARLPEADLPVRDAEGEIAFVRGGLDLDFRGKALGEEFVVRGRLRDPEDGDRLEVSFDQLAIDDELKRIADRLEPTAWDAFEPSGWIRDARFELHQPREGEPSYAVEARIDDFGMRYDGFVSPDDGIRRGFPYQLNGLDGTIRTLDDGRHELALEGYHSTEPERAPNAQPDLFVTGHIGGALADPNLALRILGLGVPLETRLREALDTGIQDIWDELTLDGRIDILVRIGRRNDFPEGRKARAAIDVWFKDASVVYNRFPFPLDRVDAHLAIRGRHAFLTEVDARQGDARITLSADFESADKDAARTVQAMAQDVELDGLLREALSRGSFAFSESWYPIAGVADFKLTEMAAGDGTPSKLTGTFEVRGARFAPDELPFPIDDVEGTIEVEGDRIRIREARGSVLKGDVQLSLTGTLTVEDGKPGAYDLELKTESLEFDPSIPDRIRGHFPMLDAALAQLVPSGRVDVVCKLSGMTGEAPTARVEVRPQSCTLMPPFLPEPLESVTGLILVTSEGVVGESLSARFRDATIRVPRAIYAAGEDQDLRIELGARDIELGEGSFSKLPPELRRPLDELSPRGRIDIPSLELVRTAGTRPSWQLAGDIGLRGVDLNTGIRLRDCNGRVSILDASLSPTEYSLRGRLMGERVLFEDHPLTEFICEIRAEPGLLEFTRLSGKVYRGILHGEDSELRLFTGDPFRYEGSLRFGGIRLKDLCERKFPRSQSLRGKAKGRLQVEGTGANILDFNANGTIEVDDARLFEVPLVNSLLRILPLRSPPVFTRAGCDFELTSGELELDDVFFYSTPLRLNGRGVIDLEGTTDLVLYPEFAPDVPSIFLVSDLWRAVQNRLIAFRLVGPIEDPTARVENVVTGILAPIDRSRPRPLYPAFPTPPDSLGF